MLPLATSLLLAAAPAASPDADLANRFDRTRAREAHLALLGGYQTTRAVVSDVYHWATHTVTISAPETDAKAREVGQRLNTDRSRFDEMTRVLDAEASQRVNRELTGARDALAKASNAWSRLQAEAARPAPSIAEVRFLVSEIYRAVALAQQTQEEIGRSLQLPAAPAPAERAR